MYDFSRQVVLITGATGNLGKALRKEFAQSGARLILLGHSQASQNQTDKTDSQNISIHADILDQPALASAVNEAVESLGPISVVCNTVGGFHMGEPVHDTDEKTWQAMSDINVTSMLNVCRLVVPTMIQQEHGKIINVAAGAAMHGQALMGAYCAAKSAVASITESLSAELKDNGINVNCVMPSIIDTPQNRAAMPDADFTRWVAPADLARVMVFLASDDAAAIHGARIPVYGRV